MSTIAWIALGLGLMHLAAGGALLTFPEKIRRGLEWFPRSVWPGRALAAIDLAWVAMVVHGASLGRFDGYKPMLWLAGPVAWLLIIFYMDELLSPRALGGLLLLAALPLMNAVRFHPSPWSLLITSLAYAWVLAGLVLVLSPYRFRRAAQGVCRRPGRTRGFGAVVALLGLAFIFLGARLS